MSDRSSKYAAMAENFSRTAYADPAGYLRYRAQLIVELEPALAPGDVVLDLACGDGALAVPLLAAGMRYIGIDSTPEMVAEAKRNGVDAREGDLNSYAPPEPIAATTCFRAIYYVEDRSEFFEHAAGYTGKKLVFDLNPRQYAPAGIVGQLREAGWTHVTLRPFFHPQLRRLPRPVLAVLRLAERIGPLARLILRFRFTYLVVASR